MAHLSAGNFPSERLMVFSAVILQRHRMIKKGSDIRRVMEKRMEKWSNDDFDTLVEEAVGCDKTLRSQEHMNNKEHFVNVFTRLMLQELPCDGYQIDQKVSCYHLAISYPG